MVGSARLCTGYQYQLPLPALHNENFWTVQLEQLTVGTHSDRGRSLLSCPVTDILTPNIAGGSEEDGDDEIKIMSS